METLTTYQVTEVKHQAVPTTSFLSNNTNTAGSQLPPEIEQGNVEYKLKLVNPTPDRVQHLITQLKWRLAEGFGEAMYEIGVADNGLLVGLSRRELNASLGTLKKMGSALQADMSIVRQRQISKDRVVAEVLFRKSVSDDQHFLEVRVAMLGSGDAGKSTLLGVLTHNETDNGRGKSRLNLLRHRHEIESGRTSSISYQIIGFNPSGELINYATQNIFTWEQICENASKIVTFLDTCGHPKYQRTTISGLTGNAPDYACLILNANANGLPDISKEHLNISIVLQVPLFIVITKIDIATPAQLSGTVQALLNFLQLPGIKRTPTVIQTTDDVVASATSFVESKTVPIFLTSSVTGENMDLLITFFNLLPKPTDNDMERVLESETVYQIEDVFTVPATGTVVSGILTSGRMHVTPFQPRVYWLGPDRGTFVPVLAHSLHRQRCSVKYVQAGQAASCAILFQNQVGKDIPEVVVRSPSKSVSPSRRRSSDVKADEDVSTLFEGWQRSLPQGFKMRKGQVLLTSAPSTPSCYWEFEAEISVLYHESSLSYGSSGLIYCGSICQGGKVMQISHIQPLSPVLFPTHRSNGSQEGLNSMSSLFPPLPEPELKMKPHRRSQSLGGHLSHMTLKTGQQGTVRFRFAFEPEWMSLGRTILFKGDNRMKCVGKVIRMTSPFENDAVSVR